MNDVAGVPLGVALAELAAIDPDRPAITNEGRTVSRSELDRRSNRLARAYAELGVCKGSFVTIGLPNSIEFYESVIATWKLGAIPQPVSSRLPGRELEAIIDLVEPVLVAGLAVDGRACVPAGYEPDPTLSDAPLEPVVSPSFKAPTSGGSTGRPKVIVAEQPAVRESLAPFGTMLHMIEDGVHLATGPLYHNGPFLASMCALVLGCHVVVMSRFDAAESLQLIEEHRVDWMYAVPTMMLRIWRLPDDVRLGADLSSLRIVLHLASPCPPWLKHAWIDWLGPERVHELFGATEVQAVTVIDGHEWLAHEGSVGRPVIGEIKVLGPTGDELPAGEVGELWMRRGEGVASPYRYIGAEPKGREGGWESVGDLGWLDDDGYLYLADRETDMILVGGANVYPAEVEAALDEHPAVSSSCVIGFPDEDLGNIVHAIVQVTTDVPDDELRRHMVERLATYKLPRTYERTDAPLRDDAGKVRRSALRAERLADAKLRQ